jgi:hypothetical protein
MCRHIHSHTQAASAQWQNHLGRPMIGGAMVLHHLVTPPYWMKPQALEASPTLPVKV